MNILHPASGKEGNLLTRPGAPLLEYLGKALAAAAGAFPVPAAHRKDLPYAVRDLSRMLTSERAELARSYWSAPRFLAAYLHYFLPWNLYRLAWLLPGLDLPLQDGAKILDLGSGPLTLPLALWCARPDLRSLSLSFVCSDVAAKPMETGLRIFRTLAGEESPWRITLERAPLEKALAGPERDVDCIMAGNILNELSVSRNSTLGERLERFTEQVARRLLPGGRLFLMEPGTRLGGKLVALTRKSALALGLHPLAPCTHSGPCPAIEQPLYHPLSQPYTGWCHFFHPVADVPAPLADLARKARLEKDSLAFSCLLLVNPEMPLHEDTARLSGRDAPMDDLEELEALYREMMDEDSGSLPPSVPRPDTVAETDGEGRLNLRVISDLIRLPGETEAARYGCCEQGLALLADATRIPSGAFVPALQSEARMRDAKTGALMLRRLPVKGPLPPVKSRGKPRSPKKRFPQASVETGPKK